MTASQSLIINFNKTSNVQKNYKLLEGFIADEIRSDIQKLFGSGFLSRGGSSITISIETSNWIHRMIEPCMNGPRPWPPLFEIRSLYLV